MLNIIYFIYADFHLMREINIDKVCKWKSFFKTRQHRGMLLHFPLNKQSENDQGSSKEPNGIEIFKLGFEVYADGSTRVLRFCESTKGMEQIGAQPSANFQLRLSSCAVHFLKNNKQVCINDILNGLFYFNVSKQWDSA